MMIIEADGSITWFDVDWAHRTTNVKVNPLGTLAPNGRPAQHLLGYDAKGGVTFQVTRPADEIAGWLRLPHVNSRVGRLIRGPNLQSVSPPKGWTLDQLLQMVRLRF